MVQFAQILTFDVVEVVEDLGSSKQFSYFRKDGKLLGSRLEQASSISMTNPSSPQVPERR
jgi:hypothetical protein